MGIIIGVFNLKGGVAKTLSTVNIGASLALLGRKVLLFDGDTQCDLTHYLFGNDSSVFDGLDYLEDEFPTIDSCLEEDVPTKEAIKRLHYSKKRLEGLHFKVYEIDIDVLVGSKKLDYIEPGTESDIRDVLLQVKDDYDYILIDFPPAKSTFTLNYLCASDYIIIPGEAGADSNIRAFDDVIKSVDKIAASQFNPDLKVLGIFYTEVEDYKAYLSDALTDSSEMPLFFKTYIRRDKKPVEDSHKSHSPLFVSSPKSKADLDYYKLSKEIEKRLQSNFRK